MWKRRGLGDRGAVAAWCVLVLFGIVGWAPQAVWGQRSPRLETGLLVGDSTVRRRDTDPNEEIWLIVQFNAPSLARVQARRQGVAAKRNAAALAAAEAVIERQHARFARDVARLEAESALVAQPPLTTGDTRVHHRYVNVLNGVALTTRRGLGSEIARLPYVAHVAEDRTWRLRDPGAAAALRDAEAAGYGVTGAGVVVGLVDTGIDYTRADLGGGIGPDYKVLGGYDFVSFDDDPMDDHYHGTAVAGVLAASSEEYRGIAPDARLVAFKACDGEGRCAGRSVIHAVDAALNPDGDATTDDAVDILNLSVGAPTGDAWSPVARAIDDAVAAGIVCVVSAGNDGPAHHTVGGTASARTALTVGSASREGAVAASSSRGPTAREYAIKPEVVAPGVGVKAPLLGGGYGTFSGTSVAAPHVAGVAALLLEKRPNWSPALVKAALMQTADELGYDVWTEGMGRVDAAAALKRTHLVVPAVLALGLAAPAQNPWTKDTTIVLHNEGDAAVTFALALEGPSGLSASFTPARVTLEPGTSSAVSVRFTVDTTVLPNNAVDAPHWLPYTAAIVAEAAEEHIVVPLSLVKSSYLRVETDFIGEDGFTFVHDRAGLAAFGDGSSVYGQEQTFLVPDGTYDVVGVLSHAQDKVRTASFVVEERVVVSGAGHAELRLDDAVYSYVLDPRDEAGRSAWSQLDVLVWRFGYEPGQVTHEALTVGLAMPRQVRFSGMSEAYRFDWQALTGSHKPVQYHFKGSLDRFDSDRTFTHTAGALHRIEYRYRVDDDVETLLPVRWMGDRATSMIGTALRRHSRFEQQHYVMPDPDAAFRNRMPVPIFHEIREPVDDADLSRTASRLLYLTPSLALNHDAALQAYAPSEPGRPIFTISSDAVTFGLGPLHWFGRFDNRSDELRVLTNTGQGDRWQGPSDGQYVQFFPLFRYQMQDAPPVPDLRYELLSEAGERIDEGLLVDRSRDDAEAGTVAAVPVGAARRYTLVLQDSSYTVAGRQGRVSVRATMDLRLEDKNPPAMTALNVMADGEYTDWIPLSEAGAIQFEVGDGEGDVTVVLELRGPDGVWQAWPTERGASHFTAALPAPMAAGYFDARILAEDAAGNTLRVTLMPAFARAAPSTINAPPVAVADTARTVERDPLMIDVLANDYDREEHALEVVAVGEAARGAVRVEDARHVVYEPAPGFLGDDAFLYRIRDAYGGEASATVRIHVGPAFFVHAGASGADDGSSWRDAFRSLQDALAAARSGEEIWVAGGTYTPDVGTGVERGNVNARFELAPGVRLYGGFGGSETARSQRNWRRHRTVLSGDLHDDDPVDARGVHGANSAVVVSSRGSTSETVLDGFTIEGGVSQGMRIAEGVPLIRNVLFQHNRRGASVDEAAPLLVDVVFRENGDASSGGGAQAAFFSSSSAQCVNCVFADHDGLAVEVDGIRMDGDRGIPTFVNTLFVDNGVAVECEYGLVVVNGTFSSNRRALNLGSVNVVSTIANSIFWGNGAIGWPKTYDRVSRSEVRFMHSIVEGGLPTTVTDGGGNLDADPLFLGVASADDTLATPYHGFYRLRFDSPAIDTGTPDALVPDVADLDGDGDVEECVPVDLAGRARVEHTIDMGAFEWRNENRRAAPDHLTIVSSYPNPFRRTTTIEFGLAEQSEIELDIYSVLGRRAGRLVATALPSGWYRYAWDAGGLASGVYVVRLRAGHRVRTHTVVLVR